jgi:hypothetical protein
LLSEAGTGAGFQGYVTDKSIPVIVMLKREAIRTYPNGQKIGLYYSQQLDKHFSIPFSQNSDNMQVSLSEASRPSAMDITKGIYRHDSNDYTRVGGMVGTLVGTALHAPFAAARKVVANRASNKYRESLNKLSTSRGPEVKKSLDDIRSAAKKANFWGAKDPMGGNEIDPARHLMAIRNKLRDSRKAKWADNESKRKKDEEDQVKADRPKPNPPPYYNIAPPYERKKEELIPYRKVDENVITDTLGKAKDAVSGVVKKLTGKKRKQTPTTTTDNNNNSDASNDSDLRDREREDRRDNYQPTDTSMFNRPAEPPPGRIGSTQRITRDPIAARELKRTYSESTTASTDNNLSVIFEVFKTGKPRTVKFGDKPIKINKKTAQKVVSAYESLSEGSEKVRR